MSEVKVSTKTDVDEQKEIGSCADKVSTKTDEDGQNDAGDSCAVKVSTKTDVDGQNDATDSCGDGADKVSTKTDVDGQNDVGDSCADKVSTKTDVDGQNDETDSCGDIVSTKTDVDGQNEEPPLTKVENPQPEMPANKLLASCIPMFLMLGISKLNLGETRMLYYSQMAMAIRILVDVIVFSVMWFKIGKCVDVTRIPAHDKPMPMGLGQAERVEEMTTKQYDMGHLMSLVKFEVFQIVFTTFLYFKFSMVQPLLISAITALSKLFESEIFHIHFLCRSPEHNPSLKRPFGVTLPKVSLVNSNDSLKGNTCTHESKKNK